MSDDTRKAQIGVGLDVSQVREGAAEAKEAIRDLAQGVEAAADQASQGIDKIGDGVKETADELDRGTRSMIASIQRYNAELRAAGGGKAAVFEARADLKGLDAAALRPFIEETKKLEAAQALLAKTTRDEAEAQREATAAKKAAEATQSSFLKGLRDQAAVLGKTQEEILRYRAAQLGIGKDAEQYIAQIERANQAQRNAAGSMAGLGQSAAQTTAALRQVPMQFTDIVTSLSAGQAPLQVFLQQGGQLKDTFGGIGPAARALGGYVLGLINPFTLAAAAGAALVYGWNKGAQEAVEYSRALLLTGNAAGVTAGQLGAIAARMDGLGTTQSKAAEGLVTFINAGVRGADGLERYTAAAIRLEEVGGGAVEKTAQAFAQLGKDPLQAAIKLNESTNFLTTSVYEQIKALTEQGRTVDAARVAQDAFANTINDRTPKILEQLGLIERGWRSVKKGINEAVDAVASIGRPPTEDSEIQRLRTLIANKRVGLDSYKDTRGGRIVQGEIVDLERQLALLERNAAARQRAAEATARDVRLQRELQVWDQEAERRLDKKVQMERQLSAARERGQQLVEAGLVSEKAYREDLLAIRKSFDDKKTDNRAERDATRELEAQAKLMAELAGLSGDFYNEWNRLAVLFKSGAYKTVEDFEVAQRQILDKQPFRKEGARADAKAEAEAARQRADMIKQVGDAMARGNEIYDQYIGKLAQEAKSVEEQVQALGLQNAAYDLARTNNISLSKAIGEVTAARLADKLATVGGDKNAAAEIQRQIDAQAQLTKALAINDLNKFLDASRAEDFGTALAKAFDGAGNSLAKMVNLLGQATKQQAALAAQRRNSDEIEDPAARVRAQLALNQVAERQAVDMYAGLTGAAKGFFNENTKGYKALEAAESAWRIYQLASDLQKGVSAAAVAVANQAQGEPYSAWARMGAMAAAMAALGFAVAGGGGGTSTGGDGARQATGTGTVLGDAESKSESIARSIDALTGTAKLQLSTQSGMLASLRGIEAAIGGVTNQVLRAGVSTGDAAASFGIRTGKSSPLIADNFFTGGGNGPSLLMGNLIRSLFNTKVTVTGSGLSAGPQNLGGILDGGFNLQNFADVNSKSKFFGITTSNKNSTQYQDADPALERQFGLVFQSVAESLQLAAGPLDQALDGVTGRIEAFTLNLGKIDLSGLKGDEINEKLGAIFGAAADDIAATALPGLDAFQRVGEGYFEVAIRVASGVEEAGAAMDTLGISTVRFTDVARKQGDVAAEIVRQSLVAFESLDGSISSVGTLLATLDGSAGDLTDTYRALVDVRDVLISTGENGDILTASLIRGAGGLDSLQGSASAYFEAFFSEQERAAAQTDRLREKFERLGLALPADNPGFRALVEGIDTTTAAGQLLKGQVLAMAEAFDRATAASRSLDDKLGSAIASALPKFSTGVENNLREYSRIAGELARAGIEVSVGQLMSASKDQIFDFAQSFLSIGTNSTEAKLAVVQAADALAGLGAAAQGFVQVGSQRVDAGKFNAELAKVTTADILESIQRRTGADRERAEYNFQVGTSTFLGAYANQIASDRLTAATINNPVPVYGGSSGGGGDGANKALEEQKRTQERLIESIDRLRVSLSDYLDSLVLSDLSSLSPEAKFQQAEATFYNVLRQVRANDQAAAEQLQARAQDYLQANKAFQGTGTPGGASVFDAVVRELKSVQAQLARLTSSTEAGNQIAADGFGAVESVTAESGALTAQALSRARLAQQAGVGF